MLALVIAGFLGRVRALLYRHEARRAVLYAAAALGALTLLVPLAGTLAGNNRTTALTFLALAGVAAAVTVVGALVLGVIAPRRRWQDDPAVARWVGTRHRPIASDLLSAVELAAAPARPGAPSADLVDALVDDTAARLEGVDPAALIDRAQIVRARRWVVAAVVANVALVAAAPALVSRGWRALVSAPAAAAETAKLSDVPLVGDLDASLVFPAYSKRPPVTLESSSGDLRGLPGTQITLRARVLVPARRVEIVVAPEGDEPERRIATQLDGDIVTAQLVIEQSSRYRFAVTDADHQRLIETTARAIEAEPDQAPVVQLMAPAEPLDVSNLRRIELAYVIEDDFGLTTAELVWEGAKDKGRKALTLDPTSTRGRAQGKFLWDIADVQVPSGGEVRYWLEAKDNDNVGDANTGRSRELHLKVVSPRERHERTLGQQQELAEKLLKNLGGRLVLGADAAREDLARDLRESVIELGSIGAAYDKDPHASDAMRKALGQMRERLDKLATQEQKLLPKSNRALDGRIVAELEEDVLELADWLDRERLEGVLDISDEIGAHQKRLADLLAEYARSKDPRLLDEIEREMKAIDRAFAELDKQRRGMAEDVLDQYVNRSALQAQQGSNCLDEVRKLVRAGKTDEAQKRLATCRTQHDRSASSLEGSLAGLRGDRFGEEQRKLDEVMNELADVAKDQDDIAAEANRLFDQYAQKADEIAKDHRRDAAAKVGPLVEKLRKKLKDLDQSGLTPFAKEERDIVERRLADVEHMIADGDLAEALGMAHQAKQSLDTIAGELEAALEDDPTSKWADATEDALDDIGKARPLAKDLIDELQALSPKPEDIMSADDLRAMERLRRREAMNRERAKRLAERTKQLSGDLPGDTASELGKKLGGAIQQMNNADQRMKAKDPSGTREATRAAADALAKARDRARSAARQAQEGAVDDEPIRIPGADEYRAPERFREDLLEAMKKKGASGPDGYDDQIKRYYEDLIK